MIKKFCIFGHVDHGKSTFAGRLIYDLNQIDDHEFENIKKDAIGKYKGQLFSRILDINEEEREKGKTQEFTTYDIKINEKDYKLIDTPGHSLYQNSIIEGFLSYSGDNVIGVLILSARKGEYKDAMKGKLKEYIMLARTICKDVIVLINKMDTIEWDMEEYEKIKDHMDKYLKKLHYKTRHYIPISAYNGTNIDKFIEKLESIDITEKKIKVYPNFNQLICKVHLIDVKSIITIGFECVIHYMNQEYNCRISKIKDKKFLKSNEDSEIIIDIQNDITDGKSNIIVLREGNNTIGIGHIKKVRKN